MNNLDFINFFDSVEDDTLKVLKGLDSKTQKKINSKYFYDEKGSVLFDKITKLDDYYPTKIECEILEKSKDHLKRILPSNSVVVEFGSGSNYKIKKLMDAIDKPLEYIQDLDLEKNIVSNDGEAVILNKNITKGVFLKGYLESDFRNLQIVKNKETQRKQ